MTDRAWAVKAVKEAGDRLLQDLEMSLPCVCVSEGGEERSLSVTHRYTNERAENH